WNHAFVPGIKHPGAIECDVKYHHRRTRAARENYRSGLGDVARASRTINRKSYGPALFQLPPHSEECSDCALRTRPAHLHEPELLHNPSGVFTIEAVAAHHANIEITAPVHGRNHAVVPERIDLWPLSEASRRSFFPGHSEADGWTNYADSKEPSP